MEYRALTCHDLGTTVAGYLKLNKKYPKKLLLGISLWVQFAEIARVDISHRRWKYMGIPVECSMINDNIITAK